MTNVAGRMYGEGLENGNILLAIAQYNLMSPSARQDFTLARTAKGNKIYVRNTEAAIANARAKHGIYLEDDWMEREDPEFLQFARDVKYMVTLMKEQLTRHPDMREEDEDFFFVMIEAEPDEDEDYLHAIAYTAFRELEFRHDLHPLAEYQFGNVWKILIVD